jgi:hypothetical protein
MTRIRVTGLLALDSLLLMFLSAPELFLILGHAHSDQSHCGPTTPTPAADWPRREPKGSPLRGLMSANGVRCNHRVRFLARSKRWRIGVALLTIEIGGAFPIGTQAPRF